MTVLFQNRFTLLTTFVTMFGADWLVMTTSNPPPPLGNWNRASMTLIDNGYGNVVVAIADTVNEDPQLIENIKTLFTGASSALYTATKHRAYFHNVTILVPESWPDDDAYMRASTESFKTANILINTIGSPGSDIPRQPFVKQPGTCGEDGEYIHLTKELISGGNEGPWGNLARLIVHEWGHLRWGLYDEYPSSPEDPHFYPNSTGDVVPTRCSEAVRGDAVPYSPQGAPVPDDVDCYMPSGNNKGHLPDSRCRFQPRVDQPQLKEGGGGGGSIMFAHYVHQMEGFCHSNSTGDLASLHNTVAPNRHNRLCDGRSAWDIMENTPDFAGGRNPPREGVSTIPQFAVKRIKASRVVMVLDASESMNEDMKFSKLLYTATRYITEIVPMGWWVALVQFNESATVTAPLTQLRYKSSRQHLVGQLPRTASGNSSIGSGLLKAIEILSANEGSSAGLVLVLSDGLEDTTPYFSDVYEDVTSKEIGVYGAKYSENADENFRPSDPSGQDGFFIILFPPDDVTQTTPTPIREEDEEFQDTDKFVTIIRRSELLIGNGTVTNHVFIDSTIGADTVFRFMWEIGHATAVVRNDRGSSFNSSSPEYSLDVEGRQVEIRIPGTAQPGRWIYETRNMNSEPQTMKVNVYSTPSDPVIPPLNARAVIRHNLIDFTENHRVIVYGDVTQGQRPVVNATVRALIRRPNDNPSEWTVLDLFDSGIGADTAKHDGIYSAYFVGFHGDGVYKVTLEVVNEAVGQAKKVTFPQTLSGVMPVNWNDAPRPILVNVDPFMRATKPVEFTVISSPNASNNEDMFPPARITDLAVADVSKRRGTLTLQWTAPGDDYDQGIAALYKLRYSHNFKKLSSDFNHFGSRYIDDSHILSGSLSVPRTAGSTEELTVRIPTLLTAREGLVLSVAFRILAMDNAGLMGDPSNVATAVIDYRATPPSASPPLSNTLLSTEAQITTRITRRITPQITTRITTRTTTRNTHWEVLGKNMAVVIGVAMFLVVVSIVVLGVAFASKRRRQEDISNTVLYTRARPPRKISDAWALEEI